MATKLAEKREQSVDVPGLIRGRSVTLVGRPMSMSRHEFIELLRANGASYQADLWRGVRVVVVGQRDWPPTDRGALPMKLRQARGYMRSEHAQITILSEGQFLAGLGLEAYRENSERFYTLITLSEVLQLPVERIRAWVAAGLIRPVKAEYGVWYFSFRQVAAAKNLWELLRCGVPLRRIRLALEQLRRWLPEAAEPLEQLAVIKEKGSVLARLEDGELIEPDGQLHLNFGDSAAESLKIMPGPRSASDWFAQGVQQEQEGFLAEAVESYRQALLIGGPDAAISYNLANALAAQGKKAQAMERYLQAVEIDPSHAAAWNNLAIVLLSLARPADACSAFRKSIAADPNVSAVWYNLADTLEEMGQNADAQEVWRELLKRDPTGELAEYARRQVG